VLTFLFQQAVTGGFAAADADDDVHVDPDEVSVWVMGLAIGTEEQRLAFCAQLRAENVSMNELLALDPKSDRDTEDLAEIWSDGCRAAQPPMQPLNNFRARKLTAALLTLQERSTKPAVVAASDDAKGSGTDVRSGCFTAAESAKVSLGFQLLCPRSS
jgi:hypothetical protein